MYLNPKVGTKEEWLEAHGEEIPRAVRLSAVPENKVMFCLVDNGRFTAAGLMHSDAELIRWLDSKDKRPKKWFIVPKADLLAEDESFAGYLN